MVEEPIIDVVHLGHLELLTPKLEESRRFFVDILGMTEAAGVVTSLAPEAHVPGKLLSCGGAVPGVELRVLDAMGNDVAPREVGEKVAEAIANDQFYVLTHPENMEGVKRRRALV